MAHDGVLHENYDSASLRQALGELFGVPSHPLTLWERLGSRKEGGREIK